MKRAILVIGMLLVIDAQAADFFQYGYQLRNHCANKIERGNLDLSGGTCHGYVMAIVDVMTTQQIAGRRACFPGVASDQVERLVLDFLKRNPASLNRDASSLVAVALSEAFPCKK